MFTQSDLISPQYQALLREMYRVKESWGGTGKLYFPMASAACDFIHGTISQPQLLDYGSGRKSLAAAFKRNRPNFPEMLAYDPGIPEDAALPSPADVLTCTDVLEHVEPDKIEAVVEHLCWLTQHAAFLQVGLTPAKRHLPDGRNAHILLRDYEWWLRMISGRGLPWIISPRKPPVLGKKSFSMWLERR